MRILGIDPGISGAYAVLEDGRLIDAQDIPISGSGAKKRVNVNLFASLISVYGARWAFIERAQAMPKQGASSGFLYGRAVGALEASVELSNIAFEVVEASKWKRHFALKGGDKESARQKALWIFPDAHELLARKKDHQRAEAALIALYGCFLRGWKI